MKPPLFKPGSVFWRVNRELVSGLAGPGEQFHQIAHPLVRRGVEITASSANDALADSIERHWQPLQLHFAARTWRAAL